MSTPPCGGCTHSRRQALHGLAGCALAAAGVSAAPSAWSAEEGPQPGDFLVSVDADDARPLTVADIEPHAKQVFAWPHEPSAKRNRDASRLNRVLLLRLDPAELDAETRERSAEGVLAYSGVCTHQGCDVSAWRAQEKTLLCFCHFSQFQPAKGAVVVAGPAPRALPWIALRSDAGRLVLASGFNQPPGGHKA
ncbi:Rieske Fe-S protein [Burkholderiales bacterium JOSHI_001]|nr:Rieske Fe-S protein [Burkholderiales bacterium JOSHI_001]